MPIAVVGLSQGAHAASDALALLEAEGFTRPTFYLVTAGSPVNADGGILTRFPGRRLRAAPRHHAGWAIRDGAIGR